MYTIEKAEGFEHTGFAEINSNTRQATFKYLPLKALKYPIKSFRRTLSAQTCLLVCKGDGLSKCKTGMRHAIVGSP